MRVELLTTTARRDAAGEDLAAVQGRPSLWSRRHALVDVARGYARRLTWWERLLRRSAA